MYRVRFAPYLTHVPSIRNEGLNCVRVYTNDDKMIKLFLQQHNFDIQQTNVEYIDDTDDDLMMNTLEIYKLYSNDDKKVHEIATTQHLIELTIDYVANEINQFLLFGDIILRRDVPLINLIIDTIEKLPFGEIRDYELMDTDLIDPRTICNPHRNEFGETVNYYEDGEYTSNTELRESRGLLSEKLLCGMKNGVEAITLEAYVKSFVSIIKYKDCFTI